MLMVVKALAEVDTLVLAEDPGDGKDPGCGKDPGLEEELPTEEHKRKFREDLEKEKQNYKKENPDDTIYEQEYGEIQCDKIKQARFRSDKASFYYLQAFVKFVDEQAIVHFVFILSLPYPLSIAVCSPSPRSLDQ
uniref:Uncharacterized protein n=1 Tax=Romanomermis culicivorax TaxID=13658 RepID=A0A915IXC3_ROMCU